MYIYTKQWATCIYYKHTSSVLGRLHGVWPPDPVSHLSALLTAAHRLLRHIAYICSQHPCARHTCSHPFVLQPPTSSSYMTKVGRLAYFWTTIWATLKKLSEDTESIALAQSHDMFSIQYWRIPSIEACESQISEQLNQGEVIWAMPKRKRFSLRGVPWLGWGCWGVRDFTLVIESDGV